jgi:hypothetical protein
MQDPVKTNYYIITIFTDGKIADFDKIFDILANLREIPLSIMMVGVGDHDFKDL